MTTAQTQTERQTPVYKQRILWTILSITSTAFTRNRIQYCYIFKMFKLFVLFAILATINAQYGIPAVTSQDQNIYRTYGNLGQVATHSKSINTPFSSVSKSDVRVSNPGIYGSYGVSPYATVSPYAAVSPYGLHASSPLAYSRPIAHAAVAPVGLLGVAYSASPAVAHMQYSNGLGLSYAW